MTQSQRAAANCQICFRELATALVASLDGSYRLGPKCLARLKEIARDAGVRRVESRPL